MVLKFNVAETGSLILGSDKGSSIYDVHTKGGGGGISKVDACRFGGRGSMTCGRPQLFELFCHSTATK
jgi:hypothetical protein